MERKATHILLRPSQVNDPLLNSPASNPSAHTSYCNYWRKGGTLERHSRNKPIHRNLLGLPNTMSSIHSLSIVRRIPIMIV